MTTQDDKPTSSGSAASKSAQDNDRDQDKSDAIAVPAHAAGTAGLAGPGTLDRLVDTARDYARQAAAENTTKAFAKDWAQTPCLQARN